MTAGDADASREPRRDRREPWAALALALAGLVVAGLLGWISEGFYQDDDICHFLFARDAWNSTEAMLHWWARPGYNVPTMLVARPFGMPGCRLFSAAQTAVVAFLAYLIARRVGVGRGWALAAPVLVWAQPLVMTLAETTLTETPAMLYLTLATWLYLRGNRAWACAAASPAFVTRLETLALGAVFAAALLWDAYRASQGRLTRMLRTRWLWLGGFALLWAPALYCLAAWWTQLPPESSPLYVLFREHTDRYGRGAWNHYLMRWAEASTLGIFTLSVAGGMALKRRAGLVAALGFGLVGLQGLIYYFGLFASGGYARFLVPGAALFAVLAAAGLRAMWNGRNRAAVPASLAAATLVLWSAFRSYHWVISPNYGQVRALAWGFTGLAAVLAAAALLPGVRRVRPGRAAAGVLLAMTAAQAVVQVRPLQMDNTWDGMHAALERSIEDVEARGMGSRPAITKHVLLYYRIPTVIRAYTNEQACRMWRRAEPGTLFYWDSKYCAPSGGVRPPGPLRRALRERGELLFWTRCREARVEVYLRRAGRASSRPASDR